MTTPTSADALPDLAFVFSRRALLVGLAFFIGAACLFGLRVAVVQVPEGDFPPGDRAFVTLYDPPRDRVETILDSADGQAWAALGTDPTFSHPEHFYEGTAEFVYRAQRPLFPMMTWAVSAGQPAAAPYALMFLTFAGVGFLASAGMGLARFAGRDPSKGAFVALMPGSIFVVLFLGPEPLALAVAICGLLAWYAPARRVLLAVVLFTVAVMLRDVLIVVPAVLGLHELVVRRRGFRAVLPLVVPTAVFGAWELSLRARYGYSPVDAQGANWVHPPRLAWPLVGLLESLRELDPLLLALLVLGVALVVVAVVRDRWSVLTWIALGYAVLATTFGPHVWRTEFHRVLLPLYAFAFIMATRPLPVRRTRRGNDPIASPPRQSPVGAEERESGDACDE